MQYLCQWSPLKSSVRIEYPRDFPRTLTSANEQVDVFGTLYGTREAGVVRVVAVRPKAHLEPVGVFAARVRGEVFLTEDDLERLETLDNSGAIALVIAGDTAGFFVREPDGSMQTIQSYQEFPIRDIARKPVRASRPWVPLTVAAAAAMTILAWPSHAYSVHEDSGQLRISLRLKDQGTQLEIIDGKERRVIQITPSLTSVIYTPHTHDVRVRIIR